MVLHLDKKGIRVLGIAESFRREDEKSVLAGIVMRSDLVIDGMGFTRITVGGMDATDGVIRLVASLQRDDINALMLNGCVISWFNIIELTSLYEQLHIPLICVTYEESAGLEAHIATHFDDADRDIRLAAYQRLGARIPVTINADYEDLIRFLGLEKADAVKLLKRFTTHGRIPEPLRVAKLAARALLTSVETV
ncbi:MAG: DUF99 family protein [Methanomicrobia archaeon]|nr:DUF99 family protein [Methanomicrobia archaeon]